MSSFEQGLKDLAQHISLGDENFPKGIFPSYRENKIWNYRRHDANLFFTVSIAYVLTSLLEKVSMEEKNHIQLILKEIQPSFLLFKNPKGAPTYNFYQTIPYSKHMPSGYWMHKFKHFQLPDDIDDTALVYLVESPKPEILIALQAKIQHHANGTRKWIQNTSTHYKKIKAYSTWFGERFAIDFDVCALCNMVLLASKHEVMQDEHYEASLKLIVQVFECKEHLKIPYQVSQYYAHPALLLYHFVRLWDGAPLPVLAPLVASLAQDCHQLFQKEKIFLYKVILATSAAKLGKPITEPLNYDPKTFHNGFRFFVASLLSPYESKWLRSIAALSCTHLASVCEDFHWVLWWEYEVWYRKSI